MSWTPGTLPAGFTPAEVWRNSGQVKLYLGVEGRDSSSGARAGRGVTAWNDPAAELRKAAGCSRTTDAFAGDASRILMTLMRDGTGAEQLGKLGPQLRSPVRGWQRAGCNPTTAARPSPAAASHGSSKVGPSHLDAGANLT